MMQEPIPELDRQGLRRFGLTTGGIVALLFGLVLPWIFSRSLPHWPWIISAIFVITAVVSPGALQPVYSTWMRIGLVLGAINTRIILFVLHAVVFVPVGLVMRLMGRDPMSRQYTQADSYRVNVAPRDSGHYENPY